MRRLTLIPKGGMIMTMVVLGLPAEGSDGFLGALHDVTPRIHIIRLVGDCMQ